MKVCFHYEDFDRDVSSGTSHSIHQWHELLYAFGVTEVAVINSKRNKIKAVNDSVKMTNYKSLDDFLAVNDNVCFVEQGGEDYRDFDFSKYEWLILGGCSGLPRSDVSLPTPVALYPREAAAIILARVKWGQ